MPLPAATSGGAHEPLIHTMRELRPGVQVLRKPYTEKAAKKVNQCLDAAIDVASPHDQLRSEGLTAEADLLCEMLELLNQYLQWLLPPLLLPRHVSSQPASSSSNHHHHKSKGAFKQHAQSSSVKSSSSSTSTSSGAQAQKLAYRASFHDASLSTCLGLYRSILDFAHRADAPKEVAAALRPYLVKEAGTLNLLGQAAQLLLAADVDRKQLVTLCGNLFVLLDDCRLLLSPACGSSCDCFDCSMSRSSGGGNGGGGSGSSSGDKGNSIGKCSSTTTSTTSNSRSSSDINYLFDMTSQFVQGQPAMAQLVHWYLHQPESQMYAARPMAFSLMVGFLQPLVKGAVKAQWQVPTPSSAPTAQQEDAGRWMSGLHTSLTLQGGLLSRLDWIKVERFLWHALATATAALRAQLAKVEEQEKSRSGSSSSSSSSGGGRGAGGTATARTSSSHWLPRGVGYSHVMLGLGQALATAGCMAISLLQAGAPYEEQGQDQNLQFRGVADERSAKSGTLTSSRHAAAGKGSSKEAAGGSTHARGQFHAGTTTSTNSAACGTSSHVAQGADMCRLGEEREGSSASDGGTASGSPQQDLTAGVAAPASSGLQVPALPLEQQLAVMGFLCCRCPAVSATTTSNSSSSSSLDVMRYGWGAVSSMHVRLEMLGGCLYAAHRLCTWMDQPGAAPQASAGFWWKQVLVPLLVLLVQQLQGAPPQQRTAFLHSPAGSSVLRVLGKLQQAGASAGSWVDVVQYNEADAAAAMQGNQQYTMGMMQKHGLSGRALVELLLLPGLLLEWAGDERADGSRYSCAGASGSSDAGRQVDHSSCQQRTTNTTTASSGSSKRQGGQGTQSWWNMQEEASSSAGLVVEVASGVAAVPVQVYFVAPSTLRVPPGCIPSSQAFFLVEQQLREAPSAAAMWLAVQLLQASIALVTGTHTHNHHQQQREEEEGKAMDQQQQQQQQAFHEHHVNNDAAAVSKQAAAAELQRLAFCSLTSSLVQAVISNKQLAALCVSELTNLVQDLVTAAASDVPAASNSSGRGGGGGSRSTTTPSSNNSCDGTSLGRRWNLAASLAAALAAATHTAHLETGTVQDRSEGCEMDNSSGEHAVTADTPGHAASSTAYTDSSNSNSSGYHAAGSTSSGSAQASISNTQQARSSGDNSQGISGCAPAAIEATCSRPCSADCIVCGEATKWLIALRCMETASPPPTTPAAEWAAPFAKAATRRGTTLQQQLQALAWQHPVPGVCGNVLCERREGPSAAGEVRGLVGTLCGRCRAAWYCCEACQQEVWAGHGDACVGCIRI